jgi:hypothetical protein
MLALADSTAQHILQMIPLGPDSTVLEFGCGLGLISERLAPAVGSMYGVDIAPKTIEVCDGTSASLASAVGCTYMQVHLRMHASVVGNYRRAHAAAAAAAAVQAYNARAAAKGLSNMRAGVHMLLLLLLLLCIDIQLQHNSIHVATLLLLKPDTAHNSNFTLFTFANCALFRIAPPFTVFLDFVTLLSASKPLAAGDCHPLLATSQHTWCCIT